MSSLRCDRIIPIADTNTNTDIYKYRYLHIQIQIQIQMKRKYLIRQHILAFCCVLPAFWPNYTHSWAKGDAKTNLDTNTDINPETNTNTNVYGNTWSGLHVLAFLCVVPVLWPVITQSPVSANIHIFTYGKTNANKYTHLSDICQNITFVFLFSLDEGILHHTQLRQFLRQVCGLTINWSPPQELVLVKNRSKKMRAVARSAVFSPSKLNPLCRSPPLCVQGCVAS